MKRALIIIETINEATPALKQAQIHLDMGYSLHFIIFSALEINSSDLALTCAEIHQLQAHYKDDLQTQLHAQLQHFLPASHYQCDVVFTGHPASWLFEHNTLNDFELVIKTRHIDRSHPCSHLDWQLVRLSPIPVYLAADNTWKHQHHVLAAIDLDTKKAHKHALNQRLINAANTYAHAQSSLTYACYCVSVSPILKDLGFVYSDTKLNDAIAHLKQEHAPLFAAFDERLIIKTGVCEQVIPSVAAMCHAQLVVMGSVANSSLKGALLGNTAEKVMHLLKTDLLVLGPDS